VLAYVNCIPYAGVRMEAAQKCCLQCFVKHDHQSIHVLVYKIVVLNIDSTHVFYQWINNIYICVHFHFFLLFVMLGTLTLMNSVPTKWLDRGEKTSPLMEENLYVYNLWACFKIHMNQQQFFSVRHFISGVDALSLRASPYFVYSSPHWISMCQILISLQATKIGREDQNNMLPFFNKTQSCVRERVQDPKEGQGSKLFHVG
ncbi:hypothetical protein ACJX0J_037236, partial [Zea mays]